MRETIPAAITPIHSLKAVQAAKPNESSVAPHRYRP